MALDSGGAPAREEPAASQEANRGDEIRAVAQKVSDQPLQNSDPSVWAVLTAISKKARQRPQGMHILLSGNEHLLGRTVEDIRFQVSGQAISSNHCKIFRKRATDGEITNSSNAPVSVFLKDTSTNGTFLNWVKLRKDSAQAKLQHGDIISFVFAPHDDKAYAFVFREVNSSIGLKNDAVLKRKSEEYGAESKRLKGIGIGAPEGPISLDDVRSLQRSNTELRQQLESHVHTVETMRNEHRTTISLHENELKELKEQVSSSYLEQIKGLQHSLDAKQKELQEVNSLSAELRHSIEDLNERLRASMQSRNDADEIIHSQKVSISELEAQLDEERSQRQVEREKAEADLKAALQRAHLEAQEEIKRHADFYMRQHKEQQEVISKLQETEKESRVLVETLRSKLENERESLIMSEKKVRQLEVQVQDEQMVSDNWRKKSETLESELRRLRKELGNEKVAREEAWAKVSALELEIAAAIRDLSIEKQRFQGARERIILRETQLRAFYSTTEEISALFAKQQEQLKSMQKTLEDEENYDNSWVGIDLNAPASGNIVLRTRDESRVESGGASMPKNFHANKENMGSDDGYDDDDASTTEKHDCYIRSQDGNTQDIECTSSDRLPKGFGSDIDGSGTAVVPEGDRTDTERVLGTESPGVYPAYSERSAALHKCGNSVGGTMQIDDETQVQENLDPITGNPDTEYVLGTESPGAYPACSERNAALLKCSNLAGETMQPDDETQVQEDLEPTTRNPDDRSGHCSPSRMEDTETGTIKTADLLASEVAGSWAMSTAPSVNGENETPRSPYDGDHAGGSAADVDGDAAAALLVFSDGQGSGSQSNTLHSATKRSEEHRALNAMINIVAPEFRQQFQGGDGDKNGSMSDAETEGNDSSDATDDDTDGEANIGEVGNDEVMIEIEDSVG